MRAMLILSICTAFAWSQPSDADPRMAKLNGHYAERFKGLCIGERASEPVSFDSVQFCDVDGDGIEEAIINGSSCGSGTGGPDIHEVLKFNANGTITNISPPEGKANGAPDTFNGQPIYAGLVGGINHDIYYKNGMLYRVYRDFSGKPEPLILQFKWTNGKFKLIKVIKNGLTLRSTRTQPARPTFLSRVPSFSSLFSFSVVGWAG